MSDTKDQLDRMVETLNERTKAARIRELEAENEKYRNWVRRIYYANIAMNNDAIRDVVYEIAMDGWVAEGEK